MKMIYSYILILISLVAFSQGSYNIVIDRVEINGAIVDNYDEIVLSRKDTIKFVFFNKIENAEEDPFLFRTVLIRNEVDSAVKSQNQPSILYSNLPESNYIFKISAFDIRKEWYAAPKTIRFQVDDKKADLIKKVNEYEELLAESGSLLDSLQKTPNTVSGGTNWIYVGIALILGLLIGFFTSIASKTDSKKSKSEDLLNQFAKEDLDKENDKSSDLKAEIMALRSQIEGLQKRTSEMQIQNQDLQKSVDLLEVSKKELESLQEQKDELFAMLVHDIKNPAAIIKSLVELLKGYDLSAIDQQKVIDDIVNSTRQIVKLSQEIGRVLSLESGNIEIIHSEINIMTLTTQVYNRFKVKAKEKNIMLMFDETTQLPSIMGDEQKIDEIISNLLSNAIKFTQQGGAVRIKGKQVDDTCVFEISDNGQGLNEDDLKKIFKKGAMLSARPTGGESSTGLGLWVVKKLVEAHNGKVWVRSSKGKGSTFAFSLPLNV